MDKSPTSSDPIMPADPASLDSVLAAKAAGYSIGVDFAFFGSDKSVRLHADGSVDEWDRERQEWRKIK